MLQELDIESYAVVEKLRVAFHPGLNLLTGETGSGKSIVVDSLALLFGARASVDVVRAGAKRARVSGRFDVPSDPALAARLADAGIEGASDELIVERQVLASGKSRAYVNGAPATLALLKELAPHLGDIHGQHEQQTLLAPARQLRMLDSFAGIGAEIEALRDVYRRWTQCQQTLDRLKGDEQERLRRVDLLRYQASELSQAAVQLGEDDELMQERERLVNAESLRKSAFDAYDVLYDSAESASSRIKAAVNALASAASVDRGLGGFADTLENARTAVDDVAFELRAYVGDLEANPERQEQVEERLAVLEKLKRKYGPTLEDVLAFATRIEGELAILDSSDLEIERLECALEEAAGEYSRRSAKLSGVRRKAAGELAARTEGELRDLALDKSSFEVLVEPLGSWSANGVDRATILFSANPGQPARPLGQVASGGELSRVALALKTCLQGTADMGKDCRTFVFDEVDTGVGGSVAEAIGRRLQRLAAGSQILCVTHIPQIACFADAHFHVAKSDGAASTTATVTELSDPERIDELARMLSGSKVSGAALENAKQLLRVRQ